MKKVKAILNKYGWYSLSIENLKGPFLFFANFLIDSEESSKKFYVEWSLSSNNDIVTGNFYQLIHYGDNIYISTIFDDFELDQYDNSLPTGVEYEFKISVDDFIKVLDEWGKIVALDPRPKEVIIKQDDDGKISFETIF